MKKTLITSALLLSCAGAATAETEWQKHLTVDAIHNIATEDILDIDTTGVRITGSLYTESGTNHHHELTLSLAPAVGSEDDVDMTIVPLTMGYNFNYDITERFTAYVGARLGVAAMELEVDGYSDDASDIVFGLGFGARYACTENVFIQVGYEYSNVTFEVEGVEDGWDYGAHTISVGVGFKF